MISSFTNTSNLASAEYKKQSQVPTSAIVFASLKVNKPRNITSYQVSASHVSNSKTSKMLYKSSALSCECGDSFLSSRDMRSHVRNCSKMLCCGRTFQTIDYLRKHKAIAHDPRAIISEKTPSLRCKFCGSSFHCLHDLVE